MPLWHDHILELCQDNQKDTKMSCPYRTAGRVGFEPTAEFNPSTHLAGEPNRPLWHLPSFIEVYYDGGGGGIRTHGELPHTCFQDKRLKPLGHPSIYHNLLSPSILPQPIESI